MGRQDWRGFKQPCNPIWMQDPTLVFFTCDETPFGAVMFLFGEMLLYIPHVTGHWLQHVHDEVVHLVEHHKVNG